MWICHGRYLDTRIMFVGRPLGHISGLSRSVKMYGEMSWDRSMLRSGGRRDSWSSNVVDVSGKSSLTCGRGIGCRSPSGVGGGWVESGQDDDESIEVGKIWVVRGEYGEYSGKQKVDEDGGEELLYLGEWVSFSDRDWWYMYGCWWWLVVGRWTSLWDKHVTVCEGIWSEPYEYVPLGESAKRTDFVFVWDKTWYGMSVLSVENLLTLIPAASHNRGWRFGYGFRQCLRAPSKAVSSTLQHCTARTRRWGDSRVIRSEPIVNEEDCCLHISMSMRNIRIE